MIFEELLHFQYNFMRKFNPNLFLRPSAEFVKNNLGKDLICAEIGVAHGLNALAILQNLSIDKLYLVDPWVDGGVEKYARRLLKKYSDRVVFVKGFSYNVDSVLPNGLDFVYIDADKNNYGTAYKDIVLYYQKVKKGGVLGGHDFDGHYPDQCRAAIDFTQQHKLKLQTWKKDWWFVKNE